MKKLTKVLSVIMITMMMVSCLSTVFAVPISDNPNEWGNREANNNISTGSITSTLGSIINVISITGSAVAIIALIILGIKYMMGSAEEKAEYKKTLLPYFFGAIMVFGASVLTSFIYKMMN